MSSTIPKDLKYTKTHEWVMEDEEGNYLIGITDHAQELMGDIIHVDLPDAGKHLDAGEEFAVLESVKTAADVYAPLAGEIIEINQELIDHPEAINQKPYDDGWLIKMKAKNNEVFKSLLTADQYKKQLDEEAQD